jgi:hypothetical protein
MAFQPKFGHARLIRNQMPMKKNARKSQARKSSTVSKRINRYIEVFKRVLDAHERDHPNWRLESLFWLMEWGLINLRRHVESSADHQITWDSPFFDLHYHIDWNWENKRIDTGRLTKANTRTKKVASATLAKLLVKHLSILALQQFTNNTGFEKRGDRFVPIIGHDVGSFLAAIKSKRERDKAFRQAFHPFSMGAGRVGFDLDSIKPNAPIPKSMVKELAESHELMMPPLSWTGSVDGHSFQISLIFQIHPFVIDFDKKDAHFPITVGLHLSPGKDVKPGAFLEAMEEPWLDPKTWRKSDRQKFWNDLIESLRDLSRTLGPTPPPEIAEAIVSITAKIKVISKGDDRLAAVLTSKMLAALNETGQVLQWDCETKPIAVTARKLDWSRLVDHEFERLLFNLVGGTRGYENPQWLTHTNAPDKGRDISVVRVIRDPLSGTRHLRVVIQCRHKMNVGIAEISQLCAQMVLWEPPRIDELIIATSGRFSGDAVQWIENHNQSNTALRIMMWPESHLELLLAERPHLISEFQL